MLRFAYHISSIADGEENLDSILQKMNEILKQKYKMNINKIKTKVLVE